MAMKLHHVVMGALLAGGASGGSSAPSVGPREVTTRVETAEGTVDLRSTRSDPTAEFAISASPDQVWRALAVVYDELKVHVTTLDTDNRRIGIENARIRSRLGGVRLSKYLACGERLGQQVADSDDIRLTLLTQVVPNAGGGSTLHTLVDARAKQTGSGGDWINCATTGELEHHIVELVRKHATS
jgi:hypothetical protein